MEKIGDTRLLPKKELSRKRALIKPGVDLIVVNVRSRFNVGALFRTSDAVGIRKIYLCGYTPVPPHKEIEKVSLGSERTVEYESNQSPLSVIKKLKKREQQILAIETGKSSVPYHIFKKGNREAALVVGNEVSGLPISIVKLCDAQLSIPMHGRKKSLNVGIAFGIVAYRLAFP